MHIVTASDENYVSGVFVLLASSARHNPSANFTVLANNWSISSLERLRMMGERLKIKIDIYDITLDKLAKLPISRDHLTSAAYARLLIPEILPNVNRVIYMDCDMLVTGPLDEAWNCDLTDKLLGAVRCPTPTKEFVDAIDLSMDKYFNSGFMVMNLASWREKDVTASCFRELSSPSCRYLSEDESALNDIARGQVRYLSPGFNVYALDMLYQPSIASPSLIRVIHFVARPKPWYGVCPFGKLWLREIDLIPEIGVFTKKPESLKNKLRRLNRSRRIFLGNLVGKKKYKHASELRSLIYNELIPYYLVSYKFSGFKSKKEFPTV